MCKKFKGESKYHRGTIRSFDENEGYYEVKYEDGDEEEHDAEEIKTLLHKPDTRNMFQALAATRYERVEAGSTSPGQVGLDGSVIVSVEIF